MLEKRYDPKQVEKDKYQEWKSKGYFTSGDISKQKFSMVIPPPNVTGKLHLGHAFNTTIQDIIARYKKAKGFDVLWLPGTDHAGIATEAKVDEKLRKNGISRYDIGREAFINQTWEWKKEYGDTIHSQWEKMGLMLDYNKERFTLDEGLSKAVNHVFKTLYDEGLIYRGERIINWDPVQKTALSNIEVIYQEDEGEFFYFKYIIDGTTDYLTVATTRPETMFGDVCLNVNPSDKRYTKYVGKYAINPANGDKLVIIADDYVDISFGTGVMKCTPAHDPNDFLIGKKYNLPIIKVMNPDATMNEKCGKYNGLDRFECRKQLVEEIKSQGNLIKIEKIKHNVGHSERSGAVVEPYLSKQWFVKMKPLAEAAIKNQNNKETAIEFLPKRFNKAFIQWMNKVEDWCISRQLWWGHRIPVYYHKTTNEILVSEEPPHDIENYIQDSDVLDTWFSSGLWPFATFGWPNETSELKRYYPVDILVTAYDILFFWVSRMIVQGIHFTNTKPFDKVLLHGLIRDEKGRKMSKSLGNGIDPLDIIDRYGVDALRYYLATASTPGLDLRFSETKIEASANFLNKVWNSARYILLNLENGYVEEELDVKKLNIFDKYILEKLNVVIKKVTKNMDQFELGKASTHVYNFVYDDFCSFYIETCKYYINSEHGNITKNILIHVLKSVLMMIYPYSPFICEEIYTKLPNVKESIMLEEYPLFNSKLKFKNIQKYVETARLMIKDIRNYRLNNNENSVINLDINFKDRIDNELIELICKMTNCTINNEINNKSKTSYIYENAELIIYSNLSIEDEINKLKLDLEKVEFEINRSNNLLNNKNFVEKAKPEKVLEEKEKLNNHLVKKEKILNSLKKIEK